MPRITAENRKWWILVTMTGSLSMILIDETVVSVALPTIQRDLDIKIALSRRENKLSSFRRDEAAGN